LLLLNKAANNVKSKSLVRSYYPPTVITKGTGQSGEEVVYATESRVIEHKMCEQDPGVTREVRFKAQ